MASSPREAKALADALQRAKDSLSSAAAMELEATIDLWWPEGTELTDEIVDILCDVVEVYANDASGYAAQYFAESVGETSDVTPADCYKREWTEKAIRSTATELEGQPQSVIARRLADHASRMVSRAAGEYVIQSARKHRRPSSKDASGVRFARVPGGSETCSFCLMLASRGWVYWSRETAGEFNHYHQNCRCTVVASNENHPALEGYDPDGLYDRYLQCREAVQKSAGGAVDTKSILREMERRDPEWLRTGKEPEFAFEAGAKPLEKEMAVGKLLKANGFAVTWLERSNDKKSPDIAINGIKWDMKQPTGSNGVLGKQTIYHQFEEAMAQGATPVIDVSVLVSEGVCTLDDVIEQVEKYVNWHFRTPNGKARAGEALITDLEGLYRIRAREKR